MTMPRWLTDMLIAKGAMSETGLTWRAGIRTHRLCRMPCLAGIDDNGLDTWCDLGELHSSGEAHALLEGRWTYDLHAGTQLCYRNADRIAWQPAGTGRNPVLAEHRCQHPIPAAWTMPPQPAATPRLTMTEGETTRCPF